MNDIGAVLVFFFVAVAVVTPLAYILVRRAGRTHRRSGSTLLDERMNRREDWPLPARVFFALVYFAILALIARLAWRVVIAAHG